MSERRDGRSEQYYSRAIGMRGCPVLGVFRQERKKFLCLNVRGICDGDRSSLRNDLGGSVGSFDTRKARALLGYAMVSDEKIGAIP